MEGAAPEWLDDMAPDLRRLLKEDQKRRPATHLDEEIYKVTCGADIPDSECAKGWAIGPMTEREMSAYLGTEKWLAARRFGIEQHDKIRQIDDFSKYFTNSCASSDEQIDIDTIDAIVSSRACGQHRRRLQLDPALSHPSATSQPDLHLLALNHPIAEPNQSISTSCRAQPPLLQQPLACCCYVRCMRGCGGWQPVETEEPERRGRLH